MSVCVHTCFRAFVTCVYFRSFCYRFSYLSFKILSCDKMSAATCSRIRTTPTTNSNLNVVTETAIDVKLGNISNMACSLTSGNSLRSSESSDPLESDYSEEADEEEPEETEAIKHDHNTDDRENDYDYDESAAENEEHNQNDDDTNDDTDRGEDVNETSNEGDDNTEDNSDTDTARSLRIYSLDDFQIIKTVGKSIPSMSPLRCLFSIIF